MSDERLEHETSHVEQATINVEHADISPGARRAARRLAYSLIVVFVFTIGLLLASFLFTNGQVHQVRANAAQIAAQNMKLKQQVTADCGFYLDLSGLPLVNQPGKGYPSELGVKVISDSRAAWVGHGCPGHLPPPSASFLAGAAHYHIPVVRDGG